MNGLFVRADHTIASDCVGVIKETVNTYGRVDGLFNNAGVVMQGNAENTSEEDWNYCFALNVTAVWRMCKLCLPELRKVDGGVIVNNSSDWGVVGAKNACAYATSKGAIIQMTKCLALDYCRDKVRVNVVCPGDTFVQRWVTEGYYQGSGAVSEEECLLQMKEGGRGKWRSTPCNYYTCEISLLKRSYAYE